MAFVRMRIKALAGFDIDDLSPKDHVAESFVPSFFIAAKEDAFILPEHTRTLFDKYSGDKELLILQTGDHNTSRPLHVNERVVDFFCRAFRFDVFDPQYQQQQQQQQQLSHSTQKSNRLAASAATVATPAHPSSSSSRFSSTSSP